jgi:hypothetical protein
VQFKGDRTTADVQMVPAADRCVAAIKRQSQPTRFVHFVPLGRKGVGREQAIPWAA